MRGYSYDRRQTTNLFVHGSSVKQQIGGVVRATKNRPTEFSHRKSVDGIRIEDYVESQRPKGEVSRLRSIFMVKDRKTLNHAGASEDYVYIVKAYGHVTKANFGWFAEIMTMTGEGEKMPLKDNKWAVEYAHNYWHGVPYNGPGAVWEYLASEVQFVKEIL